MLHFEISILPFIVVAIANFFLSWLWYSPVLFMKPRAEALGTYGKTEMTDKEKRSMPFLFLNGLFASLILSYGLQVLVHGIGVTDSPRGPGAR